MTTGASLAIRTTSAEICTGKLSSARSSWGPQLWCLQLFSPLLFSALTQFFQIFPEYQSNEFYATGEVRLCHFRFSFTCLFVPVNINNPSTCSLTRGSTFLPFPTTFTKTTPLPKWRSTSSEWQSVTDSVIQKRFVNGLIELNTAPQAYLELW